MENQIMSKSETGGGCTFLGLVGYFYFLVD